VPADGINDGGEPMRSFIWGLGRLMALAGGLVLLALIIITCVSVVGRMANTLAHSDALIATVPALATWLERFGPLPGDFEIVEAGMAFAILAFFPWCELRGAHATVDLFTARLPQAVNRFLVLVWEVVLCLALGLITWRTIIGTMDKHRYGETTFLLQFPTWWGYAACAFAAAIASVVALYVVSVRVRELATGHSLLLPDNRHHA